MMDVREDAQAAIEAPRTMPATPSFRYSNDQVATSEAAKAFSWEDPVPVTPFWDSFEYCTARNFLGNFSDHELEHLPINQHGDDDHPTKLKLLLSLLKGCLAKEEAATLPPQALYEKEYKRWYSLWQGIYVFQDHLNLPEAEQTVRMLVEKRPDKSSVVPQHMLAEHLVKIGKYKEAEELERPVCAWMDAEPRLGKDTPQAINARRIIARALWFQGPLRRDEAYAMLAEIHVITEGMGDGKFGMYLKEEKRLNEVMMEELQKVG